MASASRIDIPSARCLGVGDAVGGRYRLDTMIASGGMGRIFRATDLQMEREVAIKLLHPHLIDDESAVRRFEREVHLAKSLNHPNVIQVFDYGRSRSDAFYVVMEFLEGEALATLIDRDAPLELGYSCDLLLQVLDGLAEAHDADVLHRDMKPNNIFLRERRHGAEHVKLLDFGIAKSLGPEAVSLTGTDHACGTVSYMPPESVFHAELDKSCDVYAVGLIAAEMAMGRQIFGGDNGPQTLLRHVQESIPVPKNVAETPVGDVIRRATAKHPEERYSEAEQMLSALASAVEILDRPVHPDCSELHEYWPQGRSETNSIWPLRTSGTLDILRHDSVETATGTISPEQAQAAEETEETSEHEGSDEETSSAEGPASHDGNESERSPPVAGAPGDSPSALREAFASTDSLMFTPSSDLSIEIPGRFPTPSRRTSLLAGALFGLGILAWLALAGGSASEDASDASELSHGAERAGSVNSAETRRNGGLEDEGSEGTMVFEIPSEKGTVPSATGSVDVELNPMQLDDQSPKAETTDASESRGVAGEPVGDDGRTVTEEPSRDEPSGDRPKDPPRNEPSRAESTTTDGEGTEKTRQAAPKPESSPPPSPSADRAQQEAAETDRAPSADDSTSNESDRDGDSSFRNVARDYALE